MKNHPMLLTNTLLVIIAALLFVMVMQNRSRPHLRGFGMPGPMPMHPMDNSGSGQFGPKGPMPQSMVLLAVKAFPSGCEGKRVLADCNSPEAEKVKKELLEVEQKSASPRQIFDFIVSKYGEKVLTDEALRIRKMREAQKK